MHRYGILTALLIAGSLVVANAAEPGSKPSTPTPSAGAGKKGKAKQVYKGPTETDLRVAYTDKINAINAGTKQYLDEKAAAKLNIRVAKVNFVECNMFEDRTDFYLCSALVESAVGDAGSDFKRVEIAMVKEKDAWRVK